ncbi:MAG: phosphodiester glycosidase family protein [Ignavibacteriales bacterium]
MKKLLLFILLFYSYTYSQEIFLDTLSSRYVGPGVLYTRVVAPAIPWSIDIMRVDLKNPNLTLETVKGKDKYLGLETISDMSQRRTTPGHFVVGAINGDYFDVGNGAMTNTQVENGKLLRLPTPHSLIGFDVNNAPMLGMVSFSGKVLANNASVSIADINQPRAANSLVLYNDFMTKSTTETDASGTEVLIRPVVRWLINDTVKCVVENISSAGNMAIPNGKVVLSGNGTAATFLTQNVHVGDTIKVYQGILPGIPKLKELIGGRPKMVNKGVNYLAEALKHEAGSSTLTREPRTAAGFSADSTYLYLITLDGRQIPSAGATLDELADLMVRLGVAYGINLDGGGSTTMVIRNEVVNIPSGGGIERADGNGFTVVSSAPVTPGAMNKVALSVHRKKLYKGETFRFNITGTDIYYNPVALDSTAMVFTVSPELGSIDSKGVFTAANKAAKGYLVVKYKTFADTAFVIVKSVEKLEVNPKNNVVDNIKPLKLSIKGYDMDGLERPVAATDVVWKSTSTAIATVDSNGTISGKSNGNVKIIASLSGSIADTVDVAVQIGKDVTVLDSMENASKWQVAGSNIILASTKVSASSEFKTQGNGSLKVDYKFTFDPTQANMLYLDTNIPVYGVPDSIFIDTRSDSTSQKLAYIFSDDNGELFRVNAYGYINSIDKFNSILTPLKSFAPLGSGTFFYPIRLTRLEITLQWNNSKRVAGQSYSGTIYLDNLRLKYPGTTTQVEEVKTVPAEYHLGQNYPNPFNPSTVIEYSTVGNEPVTLKVFDVLGREVAVLVNGSVAPGMHKAVWNAANCASGIYLYKLQSGSYVETKKMVLVR